MKRKNILKMITIILIILVILILPAISNNSGTYAIPNMIQGIYIDSSGVRWQYEYDSNATEDKITSIAFFDKPDSVVNVVIPTATDIVAIPAGWENTQIVATFEIEGQVAVESNTMIAQIDASKVTNIQSLSPMLNNTDQVKVILATDGVTLGSEVFKDENIDVINLNNVVNIGSSCFENATLKTTELRFSSLESIESRAFYNTNITKLYIDCNTIGDEAFASCVNLQNVDLGTVTKILNSQVFMDDTALENVNYGNVTHIGNYCFRNCTSIVTDISDNEIIEVIGDGAYYGCTGLTMNLKIPSKVTTLGYAVFYGSGIRGINLNNVVSVGSESFSKCNDLGEIEFGKCEVIEYRAFYEDTNLVNIEFSPYVAVVKTEAFANCNISQLDLKYVQILNYMSFANNDIVELVLPKTIVSLRESNVFVDNPLKKVTIKYDTCVPYIFLANFRTIIGEKTASQIEEIVMIAPYNDEILDIPERTKNYTEGSGYTHINYSATKTYYSTGQEEQLGKANEYQNVIAYGYLYKLEGLKKITIGEGYEFIGGQALYQSTALEEVVLPETLKGIGSMSFAYSLLEKTNEDGSKKYTNITLPQGLEYIGYQAFYYDTGVNVYVDLPDLRAIEQNAFMQSNITGVHLHDKMEYLGNQFMYQCYKARDFIVDCDIYKIYQGDQNFFSHFDNGGTWDNIIFTDKVQAFPNNYINFMYRLKAKNVDMSEVGWTQLGDSFFQEAQIESLKLPKNLQTINQQAFYKAKVVNELDIPETVTRIDNNAFHSANLQTDQLPTSLEYIGNAAFYACTICKNPVIPSTVTYIGISSFMGQKNSWSEEEIIPAYETVTFDCNLPTNVIAQGQKIHQIFYNSTVENMIFTENVKELPSNQISGPEFYEMTLKTVQFDGLRILPATAFQNCSQLQKVSFENDMELTELKELSFYNCESLNECVFPNDIDTIKLGYSCFRNTGFESVGDDTSQFDLTQLNFDIEGGYTFAECSKLSEVTIPNNFNNNIVPTYMFWNCKNLNNAKIGDKIEMLELGAFCGDSNLDKIFFWGNAEIMGYTDDFIDDTLPDDESTLMHNSNTIRGSSIETLTLNITNESTVENLEVNLKNTVLGDKLLTSDSFDTETNLYVEECDFEGQEFEIKFESNNWININIAKIAVNTYSITITDFAPENYTIPSNTDIYGYSDSNARNWDLEYKEIRNNEEINTNGQFYILDEVLYLTTNNPEITIIVGDEDFDKSGIIVYGLRRDGVIVETSNWSTLTNKYKKSTSNTFDDIYKQPEDEKLIVYETTANINDVDVSTTNFESLETDYKKTDLSLGKRNVLISYTDKPTQNIVTANLGINVKNILLIEIEPPIITLNEKTVTITPGEVKNDELESLYYRYYKEDENESQYEKYNGSFELDYGTWIIESYETSKQGFESAVAKEIYTIAEVVEESPTPTPSTSPKPSPSITPSSSPSVKPSSQTSQTNIPATTTQNKWPQTGTNSNLMIIIIIVSINAVIVLILLKKYKNI